MSLGLLPERRRVVLDEDINWKLAAELRRRGRLDATAIYIEKIDGKKDGALLKALATGYEPCILVTWDNKLSKVHSAEIEHHAPLLWSTGLHMRRDGTGMRNPTSET